MLTIHSFGWYCDGAKRRPSQIVGHIQHLLLHTTHSNGLCHTHRKVITRRNLSIQSIFIMLTFLLHPEVALAAAAIRTACVIVAFRSDNPTNRTVSHEHTTSADPENSSKGKGKGKGLYSRHHITTSQRGGKKLPFRALALI